MKTQPHKVQDSHLHGGLHYSQTDGEHTSAALDQLGTEQAHDEQSSKTEAEQNTASFTRSFESVEALIAGKIAKLNAYKGILSAEIKLSFSAILLSASIVLAMLVITLGLWLAINFGIGLFVFHLSQSLALTTFSVIALNLSLFVILAFSLRKAWSLIGLSQTIAATTRS